MATGGKLQDDFLTCSVCMEVFNQPVTLACQHSFCQNCLKKYLHTRPEAVTNKSIPCPTCRQDTPVPHPDRTVEEWAGQLKPGLLLTGLMDLVGDDTKCYSLCRKEGKTTLTSTWCADCQTSFCDEGLELHNKIPSTHNHDVFKLTGSKQHDVQRPVMCYKHEQNIKLFCTDCKISVCTVCCGISHQKCEVIEIKDMLPEVKGPLMSRQKKLVEFTERNKADIVKYGDEMEKLLKKSASVKNDITKTIQAAVDRLREKETELLGKLDVQIDQQTENLRSRMKINQKYIKMYQKQYQFIQQALELEDEEQLFEMYLASDSGDRVDITGAQIEDMIDVADIVFIYNIDGLKEEIGKMDVKSVDKTVTTPDLTATPVLHEVVDAKLGEHDSFEARDFVVMKSSDVKVTVFCDKHQRRLKSLYQRRGRTCSSVLQVCSYPWCITVISEGKVAVSCQGARNIIKVGVNPDLELLSTIQTSKGYWGLSSIDQSTLVAGSNNPPSVDLIDMQGHILKTFTTLPTLGMSFSIPWYICVTRQGNILVSDCGLKSFICLTRSGDIVFTYPSTGDRELNGPYGITLTVTGDIIIADWAEHKVIHFSESGQFIRNILTAEDGLKNPASLCVDEDKLCVTVAAKGLHKYTFVKK